MIPFVGVLQFVRFDVLPKRFDDFRSRFAMDSEQTSQSRIQFKFHGLKEKITD